ncbi:uncharacterized protein LOC112896462 [Panicum hallii]|uniref:uncharacterized protein LOC112896462 n=1 Tax=Panicum hallii TaxID=206008 RepID=UPI000DF4EDB8|nr:uncharacterized protein LOC112896462 [Panicum hallii]
MTAEEKNTGEHREGQIEAQRSQVKGGELHRVKAKLWEGLSWIGKGWGGVCARAATSRSGPLARARSAPRRLCIAPKPARVPAPRRQHPHPPGACFALAPASHAPCVLPAPPTARSALRASPAPTCTPPASAWTAPPALARARRSAPALARPAAGRAARAAKAARQPRVPRAPAPWARRLAPLACLPRPPWAERPTPSEHLPWLPEPVKERVDERERRG